MKLSARVRARSAMLLVTGSSMWAVGGCLPDNYFGDLLVRLTTDAADVAIQSLVGAAVESVLPAADATSAAETTVSP